MLKLLLSLASMVLALVGVELILAGIGYDVSPFRVDVANPNDDRFYHVFEDGNFQYDPEMIWKPTPGHGLFNRQSFRGPDLAVPKPPGEFRIFAVGDSNTLGWVARYGNWPGYLQKLLSRRYPMVQVQNAGVYGYSSFQGLARLKECLQYEPDLILISFGANDAHPVDVPDREFVESRMSGRGAREFFHRFRVGRLLLYAAGHFFATPRSEFRPRVSLDEYRQNLREMVRLCRSRNIGVVLLTRPYLRRGRDPRFWKFYAPRYRRATVDIAAEEGLPLVDFYRYFWGRRKLFADESHFTYQGHKIAAQILYKELKPLLPRPVH